MAAGSRKQIAFDLSQDALKQYYPHTDPPQNPQFYKKAYADIQRFMTANGFEHRQYSVYTSVGRLTNLDVIALMEQMAERFPWLSACVNELDVTNIGVQHSLKLTLEEATRPSDMELERISPEPDAISMEPQKTRTAKKQKRSSGLER